MAYSEIRIIIGGLAHVPILIFIANFIKGKLGIKTEEAKDTVVKEEPVKIIDLEDAVVRGGKAEAIKNSQIRSIVLNRRLWGLWKSKQGGKRIKWRKRRKRITK